MSNKIPGVIEKCSEGPLILLFSLRERIRDIFTVGLVQSNYRIILADSSHLAIIKANQFLPDLVILDITNNNTKDIMLLSRMRRSTRTREIPNMVIVPPSISKLIEKIRNEDKQSDGNDNLGLIRVMQYPFNFADVQNKIKEILFNKEKEFSRNTSEKEVNDSVNTDKLTDMLLDPNIENNIKYHQIENSINKQWAFPYTVIKAMDIIESDGSCCNELARCIKTDMTASAAILKVANTRYYAKRGGKRISDIQDAVVRLGFNETRNLLACMSLINLSPKYYKKYGFTRYEFWMHSLASALIAEKICEEIGYRRPELAFLSALVHDLGKIPIDYILPSLFMHLLDETAENITAFHEIEEKLMNFTHFSFAYYLADKWNFPPSICTAILNHHNPDEILSSARPIDRILQESVYVANILAKSINLGHSCDEIITDIPVKILKDLNLLNGPDERFFTDIYKKLHLLCRYLGLSTKSIVLGKPDSKITSEILIVYDKNISYHPVSTALKNNGFQVKTTHKFNSQTMDKMNIVIFISDRGSPLDIMLYEDEEEEIDNNKSLKIYLLDFIPRPKSASELLEKNIIFIDRKHLDMRFLLHSIDHFLERVIIPQKQNIDDF